MHSFAADCIQTKLENSIRKEMEFRIFAPFQNCDMNAETDFDRRTKHTLTIKSGWVEWDFELVLLFTTNGKRKNNGSALKLLLIQMAKNVRCNFTALESAFNHAAISPERKLLIEMKQFWWFLAVCPTSSSSSSSSVESFWFALEWRVNPIRLSCCVAPQLNRKPI